MNVGGPAVQICGLSEAMNSDIFEHIILTGVCDSSEIDYLSHVNIKTHVQYIPGLGRRIKFTDDLRAFLHIRKFIKLFHPDVIHTHTAKAGVLGRIAALSVLRNDLATVHTFHGHLLRGYFNKVETKAIILIEKVLARISDKLIAVGERVKDDLLEAEVGTKQQFLVINPGLKIKKLPARQDSALALELNTQLIYIGWLGRVTKIKRPDRVIEVARFLKTFDSRYRILIAGDGPLRDEVETQVVKDNLPIIFLGWITNVETFLSLCDLMLLTSDNEGTPLSLIQAQMAGIPVIATNVGSVSEVMIDGETGLLCGESSEAVIEAVRQLITDDKRISRMGQKAKTFANSRFSIEQLTSSHEQLYLSLFDNLCADNN
jgi:glycosyltransferase involved in cell wall biosynthesis